VANLVAVLATTHHPFYYRTSRLPADEAPPFAAEWVAKVSSYRETLAASNPDVLVMVARTISINSGLTICPSFSLARRLYTTRISTTRNASSGFPG